MCVHCKGIHGRFQSASLRNFFPSGLSIGLKLTAGAFLEDMIPRNFVDVLLMTMSFSFDSPVSKT